MTRTSRWQSLVLPTGLIASILVILMPLPAAVMDVLLAVNITLAVVVLLTTVYVKTPLEFSIFPSLLLTTTLGRLVLNVATTRLILTEAGSAKMGAAGGVIQAFGEFVAGDRIAVGIIIFLILVVIQFVVITKGATRISEVAARFSLDGMPGRQMAVDADLSAGLIDQQEAGRRREDISRQADFYGAMDGASKFVRGDAIAGMLIVVVNIAGGLFIGVTEYGMSLAQAGALFTKLTIGDGLVSQIPAFLIALAAGLLVTRSTQQTNLPVEFLRQIFSRPQALVVAGGFLAVLMFTKLPTLPLLSIGGSCIGLALILNKRQTEETANDADVPVKPQPEKRVEDFLGVDPMEIELGVGLIRLADPKRGGDLLKQITRVRQSIASEIGIVLPKIRVRDNMQLDDHSYRIKISDHVVASGRVLPNRLLAVVTNRSNGSLAGEPTTDPVSDQQATWIHLDAQTTAKKAGYRLVEPTKVLTSHLQDVVQQNAHDLLTRDATNHLLAELAKTSPTVVNELVPDAMKLGDVQQVLQLLLREGVPLKPLNLILESLGDRCTKTADVGRLTEFVRERLARTICTKYIDANRTLHVITLDPTWEEHVRDRIEINDHSQEIQLSSSFADALCQAINRTVDQQTTFANPILLVSPQVRAAIKRVTTSRLPRLVVLSYNEIAHDTKVDAVGVVQADVLGVETWK